VVPNCTPQKTSVILYLNYTEFLNNITSLKYIRWFNYAIHNSATSKTLTNQPASQKAKRGFLRASARRRALLDETISVYETHSCY
jgi:hypothetical protein